jgi:two-component system, OmpR family, sensor histidine kinase BaeS
MKYTRSITVKLLLSFLLISSISVLLLVLSVRWMTEREFQSYLFKQDQSNLISNLTEYFSKHDTWTGVETALSVLSQQSPPRGYEEGRWFFTLVDKDGKVVLAGPGDEVGNVISQSDLTDGVLIKVNGNVVGTMIIRRPHIPENPADIAFLTRIKQISTLLTIGVIALALSLAFLLSRTLTRPIRELTAATRAVSAGKLNNDVPVRSRDELGELASSFNQMNSALSRSTELRRQMTADIAHELRTPVSVILGHAEAVHDGVLVPSLEVFEIIRDESARLETLIEDLRTLSRADAGELPIEMRPYPPVKLLENVCSAYNQSAAQKRISLKVKAESDIPQVSMDPGRMMQVLNNLVDNALRYTPEGGSIVFSACVIEKTVEIRVQDSGAGVLEVDLERIFDRFYRSDPSRQRDEGGSGLGLAIARSLVEKHNGQIWAESKPGQGTTIVIRLPVIE